MRGRFHFLPPGRFSITLAVTVTRFHRHLVSSKREINLPVPMADLFLCSNFWNFNFHRNIATVLPIKFGQENKWKECGGRENWGQTEDLFKWIQYSSIPFRKIKKFLDKNPKEEENLKTFPFARSLISNESPNSISTNRREEDSKRTFTNRIHSLLKQFPDKRQSERSNWWPAK